MAFPASRVMPGGSGGLPDPGAAPRDTVPDVIAKRCARSSVALLSRALGGFVVVVLWLVAKGLGYSGGGGLFRICLCRPTDAEVCVSVHTSGCVLILRPDRRCGTSRVKARGVVWREDGSAGGRRVMASARMFAGKAVRVLLWLRFNVGYAGL